MKQIRFFRWLWIVTAAVLLSGCAVQATPDEEETTPAETTASTIAPPEQATSTLFGVPYRPTDVINPITDPVQMNRDMYALLFDPLFGLDEQFRPVMTLCTDAVFENDVTLVLTLRNDVFFHNGAAMTAADVAYSLELARSAENSVYRAQLSDIESVAASDNAHVTVRLTEPRPSILALLNIPILRQGTGAGSDAVGSGRYRMVETDGQEYLVVNENHYSGLAADAQMTHMLLAPIADADALIFGAASGNLDIFRADVTGGIRLHADADRFTVDTDELLFAVFRTDSGIFADGSIRSAAVSLICAGQLAEAMDGAVEAAPAFYHPLLGYDIPTLLPGSPRTLCNALLAVDGWQLDRDGRVIDVATQQPPIAVILVRSGDATAHDAAEALCALLAEGGIAGEITEKAGTEFDAAVTKGQYDVYLDTYRTGADFDLTGLADGRVSDPDLPALLNAYLQSGVENGSVLAKQITEKLRADASVVSVGYLRREILLNRKFNLYDVKMTDGDLFANIYEWKRVGGAE